MKRIDVAVGLLLDDRGRVLIGQRTVQDQYFAKWEFPGGKFEAGETAMQALDRELHEELGIQNLISTPCMELQHDYPDRRVRLHVMRVNSYQGKVQAKEGQALQWLPLAQLQEVDLLAGNLPIVNYLMRTA
ncbi:MAG: 8-oxo-dGTP diphosphatase MutT [Gammaproteobacteria bacterium]|nr:8-oxo-dGTP diphosphatase MutT [Gammaproteobacteria bacterium]